MKPPEDNIWIETSAGEGKVYYYNSKTRETSWARPENAVIMTQEQMAAAYRPPLLPSLGGQRPLWPQPGLMPNMPGQLPYNLGPSPPGRFPMPPGSMGLLRPPGLLGQPGQVPGSRLPLLNPNGGALLPTPNQPASSLSNHPLSLPPGFHNPALSQMTLSAPTLTPGTAPNVSDMPPNSSLEPNRALLLKSVDPDIKLRAAEWISHKTPEGKVYYFSSKTKKSVWEKPQPLIDLDDALEKAKQSMGQQGPPGQHQQEVRNAADITSTESKIEPNGLRAQSVSQSNTLPQQQQQQQQQQQPQPQQQQPQQQPEQPKDKSKPVSSHPVTGTPWCIVWTGDDRVFFYNPSAKTSVWEKPAELKNRPDVDKLLKAPPSKESPVVSPSEGNSNANDNNDEQEVDEKGSNVVSEKRSISDDADDEKLKPSKKLKESEAQVENKKQLDPETIAAKQRETLPLEERVDMFKGLLAEKQVSAFSTWEKELHKIVFDSRYLLLTSKERKVVFDEYVKDRADKERQEKRNAQRKARDDFKKLLQEAKLTSKVTFSEFCQKFSRDERFKRIDKMRDRESYFNDYLVELRRKEREEKSSAKEKIRKEFNELLRERHEKYPFDSRTRWSDVKEYLRDDTRYKCIESSSEKEELFRSFISQITNSTDRSSSHRLVDDNNSDDKSDAREPGEIDDEIRSKKEKERERKERMEASLREREREVAKELSTHLRERDKELEKHKRSEAVETFIAMLIDMIKSDDYTWREARKILKKDRRSDWIEILTRDERESLFNEHIDKLLKRKKEKFRECLSELKDLTLTTTWRDIRRQIKDDPRYLKFSTSDRKCEREFKEFIDDKLLEAKNEFRQFLEETKILTYKSRKLTEESDQHLQDIISVLQNDKRYLILDCVEDERREILMNYIDELARKGPPPPPTASDPSVKRQK